jgi:regulator of extracellular matrix RemA (YlzA/DUF370 family)
MQMMQWIDLGDNGLIITPRIVAVGKADAAAMRRLVAETPATHVVDLTGGGKRRSVVVLDSSHLILTTMSVLDVRLALAYWLEWS